jgi:cytochrome c biogenesis protein CcmG, thiol:disulfide interchange protein DsbE
MRNAFTALALSSLLALTGCPDKPAETAGSSSSGSDSESGGGKCDPAPGKKAPDLTIESVNGAGKASIEQGKVTLVDFWATWCEPCKKSFPKYQDLHTKYKASGLEIIAVSVDDEEDGIAEFAKTYGAKFPVGWDDGKKIAGCWKPEGMPTAFLIDKEGVVRHVHKGYHEGEDAEIEKEIKSLL